MIGLTELNSVKKDRLLKTWNDIFRSSVKIDNLEEIHDGDLLFDTFLEKHHDDQNYEYSDKICICLKKNNKLNLYSSDNNKIIFKEIGLNTRKKFKNYINNYDIVITNFNIDKEMIHNCLNINPKKLFFRYEVLHSSLTGGKSNFISDDSPFPNENPAAYLTKDFIKQIKTNRSNFSFLKYSSYLMNHFESGMIIDDLVIKPKINVSDYGRWYWTGFYKLQQDKVLRSNIIDKIQNIGGHYVSLDFISASSSLLAKVSGSRTLRNLIRNRIKNKENEEYSNAIKHILNVFVHGAEDHNKNYDFIASKYSITDIEKIGKFDLYKVLSNLHEELEDYNIKVIDTYKSTLSYNELRRRIVNSTAIVDSDMEIIKKHRIYLQGHIHDNIILLSKYIYDNTGIFPLYTIHDAVNFYINCREDYEKFIDVAKMATKEINIPCRIEEY